VKILSPILAVVLLTACQSKPRGPVPIERDDACASCRMAISERRYAAEVIDRDGNIYKFDDIACMLRFAHARGFQPSQATFYVTDYANGKDWVDARHAHFMKLRTSVSSPMASGLVAVVASNDATQPLGTEAQRVLTFDELWAKDVNELNTNASARSPKN
jgi:copper chaperone NosL